MDLYEQKYNAALETVQEILSSGVDAIRIKTLELRLQSVFPELKESDEKVREDIISLVNEFWERIGSINPEYSSRSRMIAWLEKQGKIDGHNEGFDAGAVLADTHPRWISVKDYTKDELPPLIDKNDPYCESVQVLFVVELDGVQYINKGAFDYNIGVWHSLDMQRSFSKENVTHWMPLPPPVVSKSENAHIIGTAEHIQVALDVMNKKGGKE